MKRLLDLAVAVLGFVLLSPLLLLVAVLVRLDVGRPALFTQTRLGYRGEPFELIKFRTMTTDRDNRGELLPDARRLTRFGKFLRSTSIDELPELVNVIRGEMSLVGPRPLLPEYGALYTEAQNRRHNVRPGITGWAQVNGRNEATWDDRFAMDVWYVENQSLWLDLRILGRTVVAILARRGINSPGSATMEPYRGGES